MLMLISYHALALLNINLVANDNLIESVFVIQGIGRCAYEWEALRVHWAGLDQELIAPAVQGIETLRIVHVVNEDAAVGATVESHTQRLEAFLAGRVPKLFPVSLKFASLDS
jgi:hypothetical protein